ncbi:MFS transporter [Sphingobium chlorophenolicum]|uniref:Putative MFS permease n=1 Tax=Sphingobium chlorophenolicum TaxID=46429 RepID=A0A081RA96_SPHCR|nr:MFS transporter [Sphingobium chlorophenolicum]KEQ52119.1 putative MFS permease [Sphingobium chlorophenolicum]
MTPSASTGTPPGAVTIGRAIDGRPMSPIQYRVVALGCLIMLLDGLDIQAMALSVPSIAQQWELAPSTFGPALASALLGMLFSAALVAPMGDRVGRQPMLVAALTVVGLGSLATSYATTTVDLVVTRALTGVGLGMSIPNAVALVSEFVPARRKALCVTLVYSSVALGALTAGLTGPLVMRLLGWQGLFQLGGWLPLAIALLLLVCLPESPDYLLRAGRRATHLRKIVRQLGLEEHGLAANEAAGHRAAVRILFMPGLKGPTLILWALSLLTMFILYLMISWLPALLEVAGFSRADALRSSVIIQAGGILGGLALAMPADRGHIVPALLFAYGVAIAALLGFGIVPPDPLSWGALLFLTGIGTAGSQVAVTALAVMVYPPNIRATGLGWAVMTGRFGAVISAFAGSLLLRSPLSPGSALALLSIPLALCGVAILMLKSLKNQES